MTGTDDKRITTGSGSVPKMNTVKSASGKASWSFSSTFSMSSSASYSASYSSNFSTSSSSSKPALKRAPRSYNAPIDAPPSKSPQVHNGPTVKEPFNFVTSDAADFTVEECSDDELDDLKLIAIPQTKPLATSPFQSGYPTSLLDHGISKETWSAFVETVSGFLEATVSEQDVSRAMDIATKLTERPKKLATNVVNRTTRIGQEISDSAKRGNIVGVTAGVIKGVVSLPVNLVVSTTSAVLGLPLAAVAPSKEPPTARQRATAYVAVANEKWLTPRGLFAGITDMKQLGDLLGKPISGLPVVEEENDDGTKTEETQFNVLNENIEDLETSEKSSAEIGPDTLWRLSVSLDTPSGTDSGALHTSITNELPTTEPAVKTQDFTKHNEVTGHGNGIVDIGWDDSTPQLSNPAVEGLETERLWQLMRRFNKEIFHVKALPESRACTLDFYTADDEEFAPNKLRAQFERLYMGVAYFTAWAFDFLMPLLLTTAIGLILFPEVRRAMFPPAPPPLVSYQTGGLTKPPAGVLGSLDSATGAPENFRGEAVENEASNFVTGVAAVAINILTGKDPQHHEGQTGSNKAEYMPEPTDLATKVAVAKDKAAGSNRPDEDKTKAPMQEIMHSYMQPLQHLITTVSDVWEMLGKITTFAAGVALFGRPAISRLNELLPLQFAQVPSLIFDGVPTNAQLAATLMRLGERQNAPLPPPPAVKQTPSKGSTQIDSDVVDTMGDDKPMGVRREEVVQAAAPDEEKIRDSGGGNDLVTEADSQGQGRKIFKIFKSGARGLAKSIVKADHLSAKAGRDSAKMRLGAVSLRDDPEIAGPVEYTCRLNGERGYAYLTTNPLGTEICFTKERALHDGSTENEAAPPVWVLPVADVRELNKYSGYGTKTKLLAGWSLERQVMDGVEITDTHGNSTILTAMPRRDQFFNRLCTMGKQRWEVRMSPKDKVIAVTGGASGIGLATAKLIAERGGIVCITDIDEKALEQTKTHFEQGAAIVEKFGRLDGAANIAGVIGQQRAPGRVGEMDDDEWDRIIGVNLTGCMYCLRAELRHIVDGGSIVNMTGLWVGLQEPRVVQRFVSNRIPFGTDIFQS
ncbi:Short-chain dehydrogenase/reductase ABA4 [Paramyrothecium foliicola]|nr:Short-chain dehydrogenase/reductase ABA4 [Paramyrothecium foliicola]